MWNAADLLFYVFGGGGEGGTAWIRAYRQICQNEAWDGVGTEAHTAVWRKRSCFCNLLVKSITFLVYRCFQYSDEKSAYIILYLCIRVNMESRLLFSLMPWGEQQQHWLQVESSELLLKYTQFVLGFHALCAETAELVWYLMWWGYTMTKKKEKSLLTQVWGDILQGDLSWGSLFRFCTEGVFASKLSWTFMNSSSEWGRLSSGKATSLKSSLDPCCFITVC